MTGRVKAVLSAEIYITLLEDVVRAKLALGKIFPDADIDSDDNYIFLEDIEYSSYYYTPAVLYTSNGDGYPEEYEDELTYYDEAEIMTDIRNALKEVTYDIEKITYEKSYGEDI